MIAESYVKVVVQMLYSCLSGKWRGMNFKIFISVPIKGKTKMSHSSCPHLKHPPYPLSLEGQWRKIGIDNVK